MCLFDGVPTANRAQTFHIKTPGRGFNELWPIMITMQKDLSEWVDVANVEIDNSVKRHINRPITQD